MAAADCYPMDAVARPPDPTPWTPPPSPSRTRRRSPRATDPPGIDGRPRPRRVGAGARVAPFQRCGGRGPRPARCIRPPRRLAARVVPRRRGSRFPRPRGVAAGAGRAWPMGSGRSSSCRGDAHPVVRSDRDEGVRSGISKRSGAGAAAAGHQLPATPSPSRGGGQVGRSTTRPRPRPGQPERCSCTQSRLAFGWSVSGGMGTPFGNGVTSCPLDCVEGTVGVGEHLLGGGRGWVQPADADAEGDGDFD